MCCWFVKAAKVLNRSNSKNAIRDALYLLDAGTSVAAGSKDFEQLAIVATNVRTDGESVQTRFAV